MSHIVTIKSKVRDPAALTTACARLNLPAPVQGTARLYSSEATGLIVTLPGCANFASAWSRNAQRWPAG